MPYNQSKRRINQLLVLGTGITLNENSTVFSVNWIKKSKIWITYLFFLHFCLDPDSILITPDPYPGKSSGSNPDPDSQHWIHEPGFFFFAPERAEAGSDSCRLLGRLTEQDEPRPLSWSGCCCCCSPLFLVRRPGLHTHITTTYQYN